MSVFNKRGPKPQENQVSRLYTALDRAMSEGRYALPENVAARAFSLESLDDVTVDELKAAGDVLEKVIEEVEADTEDSEKVKDEEGEVQPEFNDTQKAAMESIAVGCRSRQLYMSRPTDANTLCMVQNTRLMDASAPGNTARRTVSTENYSDSELRHMSVNSITFNAKALVQDPISRLFFPAVSIAPDQAGLYVTVRQVNLIPDFHRDQSGNPHPNGHEQSIIKAVVNPEIMQNDTTRCIPVHRPANLENVAKFVDTALITPWAVLTEAGETVMTSALKVRTDLAIIDLAQTDTLIQNGVGDYSDVLDNSVVLDSLYLKVTDGANNEVIRFGGLKTFRSATFTPAVQGNSRRMTLDFTTNALIVDEHTEQYDGTASVLLAPLVSSKYRVQLRTQVQGNCDLARGDTNVNPSSIQVVAVYDATNKKIPMDVAPGKAIADLFKDCEIVGYDIETRRVNLNHRERGQLMTTAQKNLAYVIPLLSPLSALAPVTVAVEEGDQASLNALIAGCQVRAQNMAVDKLFEYASFIQKLAIAGITGWDQDEAIVSAGHYFVKPWAEAYELDVSTALNSLRSTDREEDIRSTILGVIRNMAYNAYYESAYQAAANVLAGGEAPKPDVIIATDPVIHQYLFQMGDTRSLGEGFNVRIASSLHPKLQGRIVFSFAQPGAGSENTAHPLTFGVTGWKPEVVTSLQVSRNGATNRELTVQPSFLQVMNLPIIGMLELKNLDKVARLQTELAVKKMMPDADSPYRP